MAQRITIQNLARLAQTIERTIGFRDGWLTVESLGCNTWGLHDGKGNRLVGPAKKSDLYELMHAFLRGVEVARQ